MFFRFKICVRIVFEMHIRLHIFTYSLLFIIISWYKQGLAKLNLVKAGKPIKTLGLTSFRVQNQLDHFNLVFLAG